MTWMMVGSAAITVGKGAIAGNKANIAGAKGSALSFENERRGWEENVAQNKAVDEANIQSTIRTGYRVGLANLQQAQAKKLAIANGTDLRKNKLKVLGAATANAAAAGGIGASVDAVLQDIEQQSFEAASNLGADYEVQVANFETQLHDILMSGQDALKSSVKANVEQGTAYTPISDTEILVKAAVDIGSQYMSAKMALGTGPAKPGAPAVTDGGYSVGQGSAYSGTISGQGVYSPNRKGM